METEDYSAPGKGLGSFHTSDMISASTGSGEGVHKIVFNRAELDLIDPDLVIKSDGCQEEWGNNRNPSSEAE